MNSLKRTIRSGLATGLMAGSLFSGPFVWARHQQQQPAEPPNVVRKSGAVLQGTATRRVEPAYPTLALGSLKQAIKEDPSAPSPYSCMAITFSLIGKYEDAVDATKRRLSGDPT